MCCATQGSYMDLCGPMFRLPALFRELKVEYRFKSAVSTNTLATQPSICYPLLAPLQRVPNERDEPTHRIHRRGCY